jgi:hypothetical protein
MFSKIAAGNQTVFMLLFAIAWGIVANVQGRWKAFPWPLIHQVKQALHRVLLSFIVLNLLPFFFLGYVLWVLHIQGPTTSENPFIAIPELVIQAMLPALANFGFYRIWLGFIELRPKWFYETNPERLREEFRHVEPTVRFEVTGKASNSPVIDIGPHTAIPNLLWGAVYIIIAAVAPWIRF